MIVEKADVNFGDRFIITSGGTPDTSKEEYWEKGTISWIGSNMCRNCILDKNDGKYITLLGLKNSSAKLFEEGTVLVALVGATLGKTALLKFKTTTNQNVAAIKVCESKEYIPEFVFYSLQLLYGKFLEIGNGKFKMANQTFIKSLPLKVVSVNRQNEFARFVEQTDKSKVLMLHLRVLYKIYIKSCLHVRIIEKD